MWKAGKFGGMYEGVRRQEERDHGKEGRSRGNCIVCMRTDGPEEGWDCGQRTLRMRNC